MKSIIFDMDGTLADSMAMWRSLGIDYLKSHGVEITATDAQEMTTMSLKMSSTYMKEKFKLPLTPEEIYNDMRHIAEDFYAKECRLKDGALDVLEAFHEANIPMMLGTGTPEEFFDPFLKREDMFKYFEAIATCDGLNLKKDNPNFFLTCCEMAGFDPKETVLIDDAYFAIVAAKEAGLTTICMYDEANDNMLRELTLSSHMFISDLKVLKKIFL